MTKYPDSTFVEDTALLTPRGAVLTRPGAASRRDEVESIAPVVRDYFSNVYSIEEPGTLDAGDVCEAGDHFFIGISRRTNEHGAKQLAAILDSFGYSASLIDIRGVSNILHLKSGMAYLSDRRLVVTEALRNVTRVFRLRSYLLKLNRRVRGKLPVTERQNSNSKWIPERAA